MGERIPKQSIRFLLLLVCFFSLGCFNFLFASPKDYKFEQWCNSIENDELIIKFKTDEPVLQSEADYNLAPNYIKQKTKNQKSKDFKDLKKHLGDLELEDIFQLDDENDSIITIDSKALMRKNKLRKSRVKYNLDRIYSIKPKSKNYFQNFIPKEQRKIFACQEVYKNIKKLEQDPRVDYVLPNRKLKIQAEITDDYFINSAPGWPFNYETQWGLKAINAEKAWSTTLGEKALVAVIDSGVNYNHPDLWNNIWVNPKLVQDTNRDGKKNLNDLDINKNQKIDANEFKANTIGFNTSTQKAIDPMDYVGHGTHVAGIIGADADGQGMVGVAPKARIMIIRVNSNTGSITEKAVARAILLAAKQGADVANLSMGTSYHLPLVYDAIQAVKDQMLIVAAAGNYSQEITSYYYDSQKSFYPAAYDEVISVAAITPTDQKAFFSNYGSAVDIAAPGGADSRIDKNILSTDLTFEGYNRRVGTSMAAPYVTGVAALIASSKPSFSPLKIKNQILSTATSINSGYDIGSGLVNAEAAI
jgi:subtilisin family serine protease